MKNLESEEYSRLASEIDSNSMRIFNMLAIVFGVFAALFGLGVEKQNGFFILCSLIPIIPGLFMIAGQYNSTNRIVTYLIHFYEGSESNIFWETRLGLLRKNKQYMKIYTSNYNKAIQLSFLIIGIVVFITSQSVFWSVNHCSTLLFMNNLTQAIIFELTTLVIMIGFIIGFKELFSVRKNITFYSNYWDKLK